MVVVVISSRRSVWTGAALLLSVGLTAGCGGGGEEARDLATVAASVPRPAPKIVLMGWDGADWNVIRPLMAEGRLPVLASLVEQGASGDLRSLDPMISPALWSVTASTTSSTSSRAPTTSRS
jgi:hypothetical protein